MGGARGELTSRWIERYRFALPASGLVCAVVSTLLVATAGPVVTTYAAASPWLAVAALTPGLLLILIGSATVVLRTLGRIGALAVLSGIGWLAPIWVGWQTETATVPGAALVRSLGMVVVPLLMPVVLHVTLAYPGGRLPAAAARLLVGTGYAAAAIAGVGRALCYDPFLDQHCWSNCTTNVLLVHNSPALARVFGAFGLWTAVATGLSAVGAVVWRLVRASPVGRATLWPALVPAAAVALGEVASAGAILDNPAESPFRQPFAMLYLLRGAALTLLAAGLAGSLLRAHRRRSAVTRLADDLGAAPSLGSLRSVLAETLGDNRLRVAYWLPDAGRYVDAAGQAFETGPGRDRAVTSVRRGGEPVAVIVHDRALDDGRRLEREIGAAARLAIDNERLRAAMLAELEGLRAARVRILETGDRARRQTERDLHDGAQQRLLAVTYELRLARADAEAAGDGRLAAELDGAVHEAQAALAELREIAQGIYPTILDEAGLGPALATVADSAQVAVDIGDVPAERLPEQVERVAYFTVREAVQAAARHGQDAMSVDIRRAPGKLVVTVDGVPVEAYHHVADQVGALGGQFAVEGDRLRAEIPCDSLLPMTCC
ncbi:sensor histidine kinase [Dactylosporangium cerinum]|uniref:histidine kinase n=1 Tax=Dactylosporangium cerinum TaxID=1434730 RepID=A0ABV9W5X9_9ACTN